MQNASAASGVTRVTHQVKRGETLLSIAKLYRTTVAALKQSNRISGNAIKAGQRLTILRTDGDRHSLNLRTSVGLSRSQELRSRPPTHNLRTRPKRPVVAAPGSRAGSCSSYGSVLAMLRSAAVFGVDAYPVDIEVDVSFGLPHFTMVGLPDATVRESRDRVRAAIRNSGFDFPHHRITVNLAPADVRKAGSSFDLPIALGLLAISGPLTRRAVTDTVVVGELSLDGGINGIRGVLPIAIAARRLGLKRLLLPPQNAPEACVVEGLEVCQVRSLPEAVDALNRPDEAPLAQPSAASACLGSRGRTREISSDVRGQLFARRALEVAAAGGHNLLLTGPPGAGKTMMAQAPRHDSPAADVRRSARVHGHPLGGGNAAARSRPARRSARSAPRITPSRTSPSSAAAPFRAPARSRSRTTACCSSTRCRNSIAGSSRCCGSRSKKVASRSPARRARRSFPLDSSSSRR